MRVVYLNRWKAKPVNREEYMNIYDRGTSAYRLVDGAPLLICIDGIYIKVDDLTGLVNNYEDGWLVNKAIISKKFDIEFKWRR